jgi:aldose 1-epimerase
MPLCSRVSVFVAVIVLGSSMTIANTNKSNISSDTSKKAAPIAKSVFGKTQDGVDIELYTLHNTRGASAKVMTFGATLVDLDMPDRNGNMGDVVLGFDTLKQYLGKTPFFGVTVGRYANRIAKGQFTLDEKTYHLAVNNGPNSLHGGSVGFDHKVWTAEPKQTPQGQSVRFTYVSRDGEENYPGTLTVHVTYTLTDEDELKLDYEAETDNATVLNLTNHSYFNLAAGSGDILKYLLYINADKYTVVDSTLIPTGEIKSVVGTPLDFLKPTAIGSRIAELKEVGGYDHNYVLNGKAGTLRVAARVTDPSSGREMEVLTTEPGVQFYSAIHLDEPVVGKGGVTYQKYGAICLETQHYPDSPNHPDFPTTVLRPGQKFTSETIYKFSAK